MNGTSKDDSDKPAVTNEAGPSIAEDKENAQPGQQASNKGTILESLGSGAFAGAAAGAAAHHFAGGKLTFPIWIAAYILVISNAKHKLLATIVFVPVAALVSVLLSSLAPGK